MNLDMSNVRGHARAKRALEVAAAGGHNVLLIGPVGCGKSMLAFRLPGILPPLDVETAEVVARIRQLANMPASTQDRPFRAPHHTVSVAGLAGEFRGWLPRPGEIGLAHGGVLFLDDLPEFTRACLGALIEPLERGVLTWWSRSGEAQMPARFQLVATMTLCPCGYLGHPERACTCSRESVTRYCDRVRSLAPYFDIAVDLRDPGLEGSGEGSAVIRERVARARVRLAGHSRSVEHTIAAMASPSGEVLPAHIAEATALRRDLVNVGLINLDRQGRDVTL